MLWKNHRDPKKSGRWGRLYLVVRRLPANCFGNSKMTKTFDPIFFYGRKSWKYYVGQFLHNIIDPLFYLNSDVTNGCSLRRQWRFRICMYLLLITWWVFVRSYAQVYAIFPSLNNLFFFTFTFDTSVPYFWNSMSIIGTFYFYDWIKSRI